MSKENRKSDSFENKKDTNSGIQTPEICFAEIITDNGNCKNLF